MRGTDALGTQEGGTDDLFRWTIWRGQLVMEKTLSVFVSCAICDEQA